MYDGHSNSAYMLGSLTGNAPPSSMASTGSDILINFVSDGSKPGNGFRIQYAAGK